MKTKRILSLALVLILMIALGAVPALATVPTVNNLTPSADFSNAGLSKILHVAEGVDISSVSTFTFSFTAQDTGTADKDDAPAIASKTITVGTTDNSATRKSDIAVGTLTFSEIFGSAPGTSSSDTNPYFPHAGEWVYTVKETTTGFDTTVGTAPDTVQKTLTVSTQMYNVHVLVTNSGIDGLAYSGITTWTAVETGTENVYADGVKVDPTIQTNTVENGGEFQISNGFRFNNTYTEVINNTTDGVLTIQKTISGDYSDKTAEFAVKATIEIPTTASASDIAVAEGTVTAGTADRQYYVEADLAHEDTIVFTKLPAGTLLISVEEEQISPYKSKVTGFVATEDTGYVEGDRTVDGPDTVITAAGQLVTIDNMLEHTPPTGIIIDNLPYIVLAGVAILGFFFLILKRRNQAKD
ncbi:MAG: hypothetical protein IJT62_06270 [Oscillospiraceae bacterium]|nr:hypothetical protein [Oscillospiraceae bacterium]